MNLVRGKQRAHAPNKILINVYSDTRSRSDAHAVKHQGKDL